MKMRVLPVFLAFLAMGFGDAVGPFVSLAKNEFTLSNTMAFLIPFAGFIMFGILSVPMGLFQDRKGKKFVLLLGLCVALAGLVIPITGLSSFPLFMLTVLLLGAGATILQVAGNPIMRDVSEEGKYSRNLSLGQFVKAIGSLSGPVIPALAARYWGADWSVIFVIYSAAVIITIVFVSMLSVEKQGQEKKNTASLASCLGLLKNRYVLIMVMGIFLYVGAEVCMSSGIPLYFENQFGVDIEKLGILGTGLFFTALVIGRLLGGVVLNWIKPKQFFIGTAFVSIAALIMLFAGIQWLAVAAVFIIGLGFANIFPLIFSITIDAMPEKTNELSGLMVTAIVGGAFIPPFMGFIADKSSVLWGFTVPLAAFVYIGWVALHQRRTAI